MNITLTFADIAETVKRSLSIIAKRSRDDNGNLRFEEITLGTREEGLIEDYLKHAASDIAAQTSAFVTGYSDDTLTLTFPSNHNSSLETPLSDACGNYCVAYALYSWFNVTSPGIADKYRVDCQRLMDDIFVMLHTKNKPTASADPSNPTASVT